MRVGKCAVVLFRSIRGGRKGADKEQKGLLVLFFQAAITGIEQPEDERYWRRALCPLGRPEGKEMEKSNTLFQEAENNTESFYLPEVGLVFTEQVAEPETEVGGGGGVSRHFLEQRAERAPPGVSGGRQLLWATPSSVLSCPAPSHPSPVLLPHLSLPASRPAWLGPALFCPSIVLCLLCFTLPLSPSIAVTG